MNKNKTIVFRELFRFNARQNGKSYFSDRKIDQITNIDWQRCQRLDVDVGKKNLFDRFAATVSIGRLLFEMFVNSDSDEDENVEQNASNLRQSVNFQRLLQIFRRIKSATNVVVNGITSWKKKIISYLENSELFMK